MKVVDRDAHAHSLAAWHLVCHPKKKGGLGILDHKVQNQALLLKFIDMFMHKADVPWVMLIWTKYYDNTPPQARPVCGSFWWCGVLSLMDVYCGITSCVVGAGDMILFWKDAWDQGRILREAYEHLFSFVTREDVSVSQYRFPIPTDPGTSG